MHYLINARRVEERNVLIHSSHFSHKKDINIAVDKVDKKNE